MEETSLLSEALLDAEVRLDVLFNKIPKTATATDETKISKGMPQSLLKMKK